MAPGINPTSLINAAEMWVMVEPRSGDAADASELRVRFICEQDSVG